MTSHPLAAMMAHHQWICWRPSLRPDGRTDKIPTDPQTGSNYNPLDPSNWLDYDTAQTSAKRTGLGVGFVFSVDDPFVFIDLDKCDNPSGPKPWQDHVYGVLARFPGAAVEVSCSGRGLHIFARCPGGLRHTNKCASLRAELYTSQRFVALGSGAIGSASIDHTAAVQAFATEYFPVRVTTDPNEWTDCPRPGYTGPDDDDDLISRATRSRSVAAAFGPTASFQALWSADEDALGTAYPDSGSRPYDASSADAALARHLAFWTGGDCARILRLMHLSSLRRDKWEREDYLQRTIMFAIRGTQNIYDAPNPEPEPEPENVTEPENFLEPIKTVDAYPYVPPGQLLQKFRDYVYVESVDRVVGPSGTLLDRSRFNKRLRARVYALDHTNQKLTTDAWKAFHESQCYDFHQADCLAFEPGRPDRVFREGVKSYANTWRDQAPQRCAGDVSPFLDHLRLLLPENNDAYILLAYLAACVQHQGTKFAWSPLVQGVQGNGKSTIAKILRHAVGGYVHTMPGSRLTAQFNGWISENVVCVVEDIQIRGDRSGSLEIIKPMITEEYQQVERKGIDQVSERVCCNLILLTNHQDAIPVDRNERRFAVFFCAQQTLADLTSCGLTEEYFARLYAWLEDREGYAIVAEYLHTYPIPHALDPAGGCRRAPRTSSQERAIKASLCPKAQVILEAAESGEPGFRGGWVSSKRAVDVLAQHHQYVSPQRLVHVLERIGYIPHPALTDGKNSRASRVIPQEGGRPRLFVARGHIAASVTHDATGAYAKAQGYLPVSGPPVTVQGVLA